MPRDLGSPLHERRLKEAFKAAIVRRRRDLELTQQQVADRLNVSASWVANVETGSENVTLATMAKFAQALEMPVSDLLRAVADVLENKGQ